MSILINASAYADSYNEGIFTDNNYSGSIGDRYDTSDVEHIISLGFIPITDGSAYDIFDVIKCKHSDNVVVLQMLARDRNRDQHSNYRKALKGNGKVDSEITIVAQRTLTMGVDEDYISF